jgi:M3 family oligoendopeptidase
MITFSHIHAPKPTPDSLKSNYEMLFRKLESAKTSEDALVAVKAWDDYRRELATWEALVDLRFNQDTQNESYRHDRDWCDEMRPQFADWEVKFKRTLLEGDWRASIQREYGSQVISLWEADLKTFEPAIADDLISEAKLQSEYTELTAAARFTFRGEQLNLSGILKYREDPDRETRHTAERVRWQWFADNRPSLDRIYHQQVELRHAMARKLGFANFIGLGYARMKRVDYTQDDVEQFRAAVRTDLVPLCVELRKQQAARLGVEKLMFWDEAVHDPQGNPAPRDDHDWLVEQAQKMFDAMGGGLDDFFRLMTRAELTDLKNRESKSPGGFCTSFPTVGLPYIFANFNGTKHDVEVFTHEMGHAFQAYESRHQPLVDYLWPTYESCEIHSMGLEFLTWPHMELFFGTDADRFRRIHLEQALLFIPYGVAVDHFQHQVYAWPDATPAERHAMWQQMEEMYLPWRDYGDLPHVKEGGAWQFQRHIYLNPFYYIDYTLAQTCALQLWVRSRKDAAGTLRDYVSLCRRGGEAPFQELANSAGLMSPFQPGCLREVVHQASTILMGK